MSPGFGVCVLDSLLLFSWWGPGSSTSLRLTIRFRVVEASFVAAFFLVGCFGAGFYASGFVETGVSFVVSESFMDGTSLANLAPPAAHRASSSACVAWTSWCAVCPTGEVVPQLVCSFVDSQMRLDPSFRLISPWDRCFSFGYGRVYRGQR
ncbi:hypothetical protein PR001_g346 [Phytophthora rubi]|uniref:Secreted protein n=1 Tax=Phytophthora rubi TaxID=129364 RepID=A0A6A3NZW0_9STRA|nr:hypothetical protein PR002_g323 [Phytophthora rubi]KAE9052588.1 hypothetical protein PR001_g346 [Phytophthora rubi]